MTKAIIIAVTPLLVIALAVSAWANQMDELLKANEIWLAAYESGDVVKQAQAMGLVAGVSLMVQSFITPTACPSLKERQTIELSTIAAGTAQLVKEHKVPLVVAATFMTGREMGCPDAVSAWVKRANAK